MVNKIEPYKGIAEIYDEIRPSYPEKLIEDIIFKTDLNLNNRILEIGAGTGKATVQFAKKGFAINAIELGEEMAAILKKKCTSYPKVSLDIAPFEQWESDNNEKFHMIYSAQAFHWLDKNVKYKKCHELLKDNGFLVLFWYTSSNDELSETMRLRENIDSIVNKYVSSYAVDSEKPQRREHDGHSEDDERKSEIEASGLFELVEKIEYTEETKNNAKQYLKVLNSVPAFASKVDGLSQLAIENMNREIEELINSNGGYVGALFNFTLYIARKIS